MHCGATRDAKLRICGVRVRTIRAIAFGHGPLTKNRANLARLGAILIRGRDNAAPCCGKNIKTWVWRGVWGIFAPRRAPVLACRLPVRGLSRELAQQMPIADRSRKS